MKISAVYKITNTVTNDFYIGSSKNVKQRLADHKCNSTWKNHPNNPMYIDMKEYGVNKFDFEILEVVEVKQLKEMEQHYIELLKPTYNRCNAKGLNVERKKEYQKEYQKEYRKTEKYKEYEKSEKRKKAKKEYGNQLCIYNGKTITLNALSIRFWSQGISHPTTEAKKYLVL